MTDPCAPLVSKPKAPELEPAYAKQVADRFEGVLKAARKSAEAPVDLKQPKVVIFSDHHKGGRDGADDFQRCERAYCAALGYYLEMGFRLFVLGDAEELWEETPARVLRCYPEVLELEAQFADPGRGGLVRFYGNHDDHWAEPENVKRDFSGVFPNLEVRESLLMPLSDDGDLVGELLFAHGHQGTTESDRYGKWARLPVRYLWRPLQRKLGYSATTPASDFRLRGIHDRAMFEWAQKRPRKPALVLITGHTHRPVFSLPQKLTREIEDIERDLAAISGDNEKTAELRAELEHARATARDRNAPAVTVDTPCYFNSGCCSFPDGDVTGLEIENGNISLVRWPDDDDRPRRRQLGESLALRDAFSSIRDTAPGEAKILERLP